MTTLTQGAAEDFRERFRLALLAASDTIMNELLGEIGAHAPDNCTGARDADLPALFPALDAQFLRNLAHAGVTVEEEEARVPTCPNCRSTRVRVQFTGTCELTPDGSEDCGDHEYDDGSGAVCATCGFGSILSVFRRAGLTAAEAEDAADQRARSQ